MFDASSIAQKCMGIYCMVSWVKFILSAAETVPTVVLYRWSQARVSLYTVLLNIHQTAACGHYNNFCGIWNTSSVLIYVEHVYEAGQRRLYLILMSTPVSKQTSLCCPHCGRIHIMFRSHSLQTPGQGNLYHINNFYFILQVHTLSSYLSYATNSLHISRIIVLYYSHITVCAEHLLNCRCCNSALLPCVAWFHVKILDVPLQQLGHRACIIECCYSTFSGVIEGGKSSYPFLHRPKGECNVRKRKKVENCKTKN